jgi:uncharacterized protein (DUF952 family)
MGFHVEINSILRSDATYDLARGKVHPFRKEGSRIFFDDIPIWLTRSDWTALAEVRVVSQTRTPDAVAGTFRVLHVYEGAEQVSLTVILRRMFAGGTDPFVYVTMSQRDFDTATASGVWNPGSLATDGFLHASPADQLTRVANKHFSGLDEIRILSARAENVHAEILWEPASDRKLYPHIYGPLNMDAVERATTVKKGPDGRFVVVVPRA